MKTERRLGPGDDLLMINSPAGWPCWPILPMKNRVKTEPDGSRLLGIILDGNPTTVLIGTLGLTDWKKATKMTYHSVEALLADHWIVD